MLMHSTHQMEPPPPAAPVEKDKVPMNSGPSSYKRHLKATSCFPKQSAREACQGIIDAIHRCNMYMDKKSLTGDENEISLDHILSNVPYKDMLQDLFGLDQGECLHPPSVPVVTKTYEESWNPSRMSCTVRDIFHGTFSGPGSRYTVVTDDLHKSDQKVHGSHR
jgi:hypothetical protein